MGVILFFVLSGFLITYLLLVEEHIYKQISIRSFYIRRILRIWPLYFLIIIIALFILPNLTLFTWQGYEKDIVHRELYTKIILFIFFLPNMVLLQFGIIPYASHTWSIGTEEQFYLIWPIVLKYFKKYRIGLMLMIIIYYLSFKFFLQSDYSDNLPYRNLIISFWSTFNIDCMAIGGLYAVLLFQKRNILKVLRNNFLFYSILIITILLLLKGVYVPYFHYEFYSILFGIIILNFASNNTIKISLEYKLFRYLGDISYGLYMYHPIGIVLALSICKSINITSNWLIYPLCIMLTIIIAGFSYKFFESYFLRYKNKFSNILSGGK